MDVILQEPENSVPVPRAYVLTMVIRSFKGRRDVDVHLFRAAWPREEEERYDWTELVGPPLDGTDARSGTECSRYLLLEAFTREERDMIVEYLKNQYADRLIAIHSCVLQFPIPGGLAPLSSVAAGKSVGILDFARIPSYSLPLPLKGLYDLDQHRPLIEGSDPE